MGRSQYMCSFAAKAGMQAGDVIVEFDGKPIKKYEEVPIVVSNTPVGTKVKLRVLRKDKEVTLNATVGELPDEEPREAKAGGEESKPEEQGKLGLTLQNLNPELRDSFKLSKDDRGVVVSHVDPKSDAAEKGLQPGDLILEVNRTAVTTVDEVAKALKRSRCSVAAGQ